MDLADGFPAEAFAAATAGLDEPACPATTPALVPTQLVRLLDHPRGRRRPAAPSTRCSSAAPPPPPRLRPPRRARRASRVLDDLRDERDRRRLRLRREAAALHRGRASTTDGRIHLGGATLAHGYLGRPDLTAAAFGGRRRRACGGSAPTTSATPTSTPGCTSTAGSTTWSTPAGSRWRRGWSRRRIADHVPGVREVVVVGSPDPEWGEAVVRPRRARAGRGARGPRPPPTCGRTCAASCPTTRCPDGRADRRPGAPARAGQARPACGGRHCSAWDDDGRAPLRPGPAQPRADDLLRRRRDPDRRGGHAQPARRSPGCS